MTHENVEIHESIKKKLDCFLMQDQVPNILLHGPCGGGKRTLVKDFIAKLYNDEQKDLVMYVDCGHGKGIKFIRDDLKFFAKTNILNSGEIIKSIIYL